jgi:hypothetical protein
MPNEPDNLIREVDLTSRQNFRDWLAAAKIRPIEGPPPAYLKPKEPEFEQPPAEKYPGPLFGEPFE